ncbi:dispanin subfamily A member 2b-like [Scyliorhinus canicula]|uniref:dispanin subfamily A member 2b-like n=1 Tax=Scyliorhinus canicula TaxID=7830 RepID=UPI0018F3DA8A|nr:dispanin subfamily A member 2b-like [Scyliorhinus canicula]
MEDNTEKEPMNPGIYPGQEGQRDHQLVPATVITMPPKYEPPPPQYVLRQYEPPVRDHLLWSLFNFGCLNFCCLGFVALVYSVKARDRKVVGDVDGSRHYASTARSFNIAATVLSIVAGSIYIVLRLIPLFLQN